MASTNCGKCKGTGKTSSRFYATRPFCTECDLGRGLAGFYALSEQDQLALCRWDADRRAQAARAARQARRAARRLEAR